MDGSELSEPLSNTSSLSNSAAIGFDFAMHPWNAISEWFWHLPQNIQTPLIQSIGAIGAALIALTGVVLTLVLTLRWNARKHHEDRVLSLKKDVFVSFLANSAKDTAGWLIVNEPPDDKDDLHMNESLAAVRLIADRASREAVEKLVEVSSAGGNASFEARREMTAIAKKIEAAKRDAGSIATVLPGLSAKLFERQAFHLRILVEHATAFERAMNVATHEFRKELHLEGDAEWFLTARPSKFDGLLSAVNEQVPGSEQQNSR